MYYSYLAGLGSALPEPITRREYYLYYLCVSGAMGGATQEQIENAVNNYLEQNPVFVDNIGNGLYIDDSGKVSVETTDVIEKDNTKPVTSASVYTVCGNIESLLSII